MGKIVKLCRQELVWQIRNNSWSETDYKKYLAWLKSFKDQGKTTSWYRNHIAIYEVLSAYTWDEVAPMAAGKVDYDEQEKIPQYDDNGEITYHTCIGDVLVEAIREDNYTSDVYDEEYADDYDESWNLIECPDEELSNGNE